MESSNNEGLFSPRESFPKCCKVRVVLYPYLSLVAFLGAKEKVKIFENGWVTLRTITIERPCYEMSISCTEFVSLRCVHRPSNVITGKANLGLLQY